MAVPKQRHTKSRRDRRRVHLRLTLPQLVTCPKCGKLKLPHTACSYCGYYKDRKIIDVLKKVGKKERKKRLKEMKKNPPKEDINLENLSSPKN